MKYLKYSLAIALVCLVSVVLWSPATEAATTYVSDYFSRTRTDKWGKAGTGGAYTLSGPAANFDVNGSVGTMNVPAGVTLSAYLNDVSAHDVNGTFLVKSDKVTANGGQMIYFIARRVSDGNDYMGRIRITPDGVVRVGVMRELGGSSTLLGSEAQVPNLTYTAGKLLRLRMQITGVNPTTLRIRAWENGKGEPTNWQVAVTDSQAILQANGSVGIRTYVAGRVTNGPVLFSFDEFVVTSVDSAAPPPPTNTPVPPPSGAAMYWGALVDGAIYGLNGDPPYDFAGLDKLESNVGKKVSILRWGQPWHWTGHTASGYAGIGDGAFQRFPTSQMNALRQRGVIPYLDWASWEMGAGSIQPNYQNADIYAGKYDTYIRRWAQEAKAWGYPFFLRFNPELNGWWYPWGEGRGSTGTIVNGNQPGDFVKAWRHVHDIFEAEGAHNVTWLWTINHMTTNTTGGFVYPLVSTVYPGDAYVDWTGLSVYNRYSISLPIATLLTGNNGQTWLRNSYQEVLNVAPNKPMMLAETASFEYGGVKSAWITDFLSNVSAQFPKIKAFTWYNAHDVATDTYPIESSVEAQNAFKAGIASGLYAGSIYSNLNSFPITPP